MTLPSDPTLAGLAGLVGHLRRLLVGEMNAAIRPHGVAPGQLAPLAALHARDGLTQRELCEAVGIGQPTMAKTLQRMERDGLIRRNRDPEDGRKTRMYLTWKARGLFGELASAVDAVDARATDGLDDEEIAAFTATIEHLIANLAGESVAGDSG